MTSPPPPKKTKQTNKGKKKERERMDEENMNNAELNVNQIDILNGHQQRTDTNKIRTMGETL